MEVEELQAQIRDLEENGEDIDNLSLWHGYASFARFWVGSSPRHPKPAL